ncbi:hypothetical protein CWC03_17495 [Pseudoalteromonas sp. S2755]|nr:hypothetical protein CWC03_17495 [Pseudoalteromonas sp. S2755]
MAITDQNQPIIDTGYKHNKQLCYKLFILLITNKKAPKKGQKIKREILIVKITNIVVCSFKQLTFKNNTQYLTE